MKYILSICVILMSGAVIAEGQGQSVMFQNNNENNFDHLTTMPEKQSLGDKCERMSKEIENLKGKPLRRYTLQQRYKQECELK